ncbi:hypothetical protein DYB36_013220 [Aphanomyces astaci]|uniref:Uncharacterized protein n=1 Tax=Aphanomyces astaci TaxID=112090 RepID=A0A397A203_APHAT|nr:hypothetical protein DYB36_013220 [Aphanomyces astaci]
MANFLAFITVFAAMASATVNQTDDRQLQTTDASFCWKTSQTRGIGQVPVSCATGQERLGLLCYDKCPVGTTRKGLDCHSNCPAGFADQGLFCRNSEYGRGAGYPWKFGDWLNDRGMYKRCQKDHGQGKCEKWGWVVYPKCLPGYTSFGCCICRPTRPNCEALGLGGRLDLSCAKKITIMGPSLGTCASNEDRDAGLCYPKCNPNYTGVGPVCWGRPPTSWVHCGLGAAKTSRICATAIKDQILSVGQLVFNIGTAFTGSSAKALQAPADVSKVAELTKAWDTIKNKPLVKRAMQVYDTANRGKTGYQAIEELEQANSTTEDYVRIAASIASILDPTGISDVIAAYTYSTCDKVAA